VIDTSNNLSPVQAQTLQTSATAVSHRKTHSQSARTGKESPAASPDSAISNPVSASDKQAACVTLPPISQPQQAYEAMEHARALIQAHARTALLAQANASSQSVERLLS